MLSRLEHVRETWGGAHTAIDAWLSERQNLLVRYCKLAGLPPYDKRRALPAQENLEQFCEVLVDYVSTAHFDVYERIVKAGGANCARNHALAEKLYPRIADTTDAALEFNDRYADHCEEEALASLDMDLTALGRALQVRFEIEDELIATIFEEYGNRGRAA